MIRRPSFSYSPLGILAASALLVCSCGDDDGRSSDSFDSLPTGITTVAETGSGDGDGDGDGPGDGDGDGPGDGDGDGPGDGDGDGDDGPGDGDGSGDGDGDGQCPSGTIICQGKTRLVCDGMGDYSSEELCDDACAPGIGCVACLPGTGYCSGDLAYACNAEGTGHIEQECDPLQNISCTVGKGTCDGACSPQSLGNSYIGCDYYPTITPNPLLSNTGTFTFAVAVANTAASPTTVTVTRNNNVVASVMVAANSVQVITLPWVDALRTGGNNTGSSKIVADGAYRLRSSQPVTVYQYNPLQYTAGGNFSYTNDASLLLPYNTWREEVRVVAWNHSSSLGSSFYAVTAAEDGTQVQLAPSATGQWVLAGAGVAANGTGNVMLNSSDVLVVFSGNSGTSDPSGTLVTASKPVQVIGGHNCTRIPENVTACDHIEASVPPLEAVGRDYFVTVPLITAPATIKARMVRIVATEPNTTLVYDPPIGGAPTTLAQAGAVVTINATSQDFRITSPQKILVSEYMQGQSAGGNKGDPAMTLAVPVEQYRTNYLVHAPTNYSDSFANIVAPTGVEVTVDGAPVTNWTSIGDGAYSVARVVFSNAGDGNHVINSVAKFGIQVYGYGQWTSYWYPGGQDLTLVAQ
jgi:hypothetical protein